MISHEMKAQVEAHVDYIMSELLGDAYTTHTGVTFSTTMKKVAGRAYTYQNRIELNEQLFIHNTEEFFNVVIVHECAHIATKILYPDAKQAHGPEFRSVMNLFGLRGDTYHNMDTSVATPNRPSYKYTCVCDRVINLTKTLHNKIVNRGQNRICKACKTRIIFTGLVS
jgi:SprT protein